MQSQLKRKPERQPSVLPFKQPKLRTYRKQEHFAILSAVIYTFILGIWTVSSAIKVNTMQHRLQTINDQVTNYRLKNQTLKQDIDQQLSFDNLNTIAHQDHLKLHSNQVQVIK